MKTVKVLASRNKAYNIRRNPESPDIIDKVSVGDELSIQPKAVAYGFRNYKYVRCKTKKGDYGWIIQNAVKEG